MKFTDAVSQNRTPVRMRIIGDGYGCCIETFVGDEWISIAALDTSGCVNFTPLISTEARKLRVAGFDVVSAPAGDGSWFRVSAKVGGYRLLASIREEEI